jgi:predicted esterase
LDVGRLLAPACGNALILSLRGPKPRGPGGFCWFEGSSASPAPDAEASISWAADQAQAALDVKVILTPPYIFHWRFSMDNIQGGVRMPLISMPINQVQHLLEHAPSELGTDPARAYLFGHSQGAAVAWAVALSEWPRPD